MSLINLSFTKVKKNSLYYKLAYLKKRIKNEKKLISWSFLVVNSSSEFLLDFLRKLKQLNFIIKRKKIVGTLSNNSKNHNICFKGLLLNIDFLDIGRFIDFFTFYYTQIDSLVFNFKTLGFFYDKFFFSFFTKKEFFDFRKNFVEPLKTKKFLPLFVQTINKFRTDLMLSLNNCFINFFLQLSSYKIILNEKNKN